MKKKILSVLVCLSLCSSMLMGCSSNSSDKKEEVPTKKEVRISSSYSSRKLDVDSVRAKAYGGGDDKEHEIVIESPAQNTWVSFDIPLSDFTNLKTRGHISQLIYAAAPSGSVTVYIDNVYFHN